MVFYNRSNEAAAQLKPGDFDWKGIFAGGVRWFHSGVRNWSMRCPAKQCSSTASQPAFLALSAFRRMGADAAGNVIEGDQAA